MTRSGLRAAALAAACAASAGCKSQWYEQASHTEIVRTDVVIRSDPPGAMVWFNGLRQDTAPIRIPVDYEHTTEQWVRQSNYGQAVRDSMGGAGILLFPVWIPASFFHGEEELKRHVYGGARHMVLARLDGHDDAERQIDLQGEAQVDVLMTLVPSARR